MTNKPTSGEGEETRPKRTRKRRRAARQSWSFQTYDKRRSQLHTRALSVTTPLKTMHCLPVDIRPGQPGYLGTRWTYLLKIEFDPANGFFTRDMMNAIAGSTFRLDTKLDVVDGRGIRVIHIVCTPKRLSKRDIESFHGNDEAMDDIRPPWQRQSLINPRPRARTGDQANPPVDDRPEEELGIAALIVRRIRRWMGTLL